MTNKKRVIFLDIDGPIIPAPLYVTDMYCSVKRTIVSTCAIGWLVKLCKISGAKIVTNSAHNYHENLMMDLIKHGISSEHFHEQWRTDFPHVQGYRPRLAAINQWLDAQEEEYDWVGFDDENYKHPNLVVCSFNDGITFSEFMKAAKIFGCDEGILIP